MIQHRTSFGRALFVAAVLLASTAALGFSQSAPHANGSRSSEPGVLVISVQPGSPAEKAGLSRGDIILDVNGSAVDNVRDVRDAISSHKQGDTISLNVRHGDARKKLSVALGEKDGRVYVGALLLPAESDHTSMAADQKSWPWALSEVAIVARVSPGGPADKAGIRNGDVILSVDGVRVDANHSLSALIHDKKIGDKVTLAVWTRQTSMDNTPQDVKVTLGSTPDRTKPWLGVEYRMNFSTAFLDPRGVFLPLANIQAPDLSRSLPYVPALPETRIASIAAPVV